MLAEKRLGNLAQFRFGQVRIGARLNPEHPAEVRGIVRASLSGSVPVVWTLFLNHHDLAIEQKL